MKSKVEKHNHLKLFIENFLQEGFKERYLVLVKSEKGLRKIKREISHFRKINPDLIVKIPSNKQSVGEIYNLLKQNGASQNCFVISEDCRIDGLSADLFDILSEVVGSSNGTLLSCIPGKLLYYESEDKKIRMILKK